MIKLIVEINEKGIKEYKNIVGTQVEVSVQELGKNATKGEKEVSKQYKERLKIDKKFQYLNNSSLSKKEVLDELIDELFCI